MSEFEATPTTHKTEGDVVDEIQGILFPEGDDVQDQQIDSQDQQAEVSDVVEEGDDESTQDDDTEDLKAVDDDDGEISDNDKTLADYLGISDDQLIVKDDGEVLVSTKIDGKLVQAPLNSLVKNYQLESHIQRRSQEVAEQQRQLQETAQVQKQKFDEKLEHATALSDYMEKQLVSEYNSVNWDAMEREDPTQFVIMKQKYAEQARAIEQAKGLITKEKEDTVNQQRQQFEHMQAKHRQEQINLIMGANPTWIDDEVRSKDINDIESFLKSTYGFGDEDMQYVIDSKIMSLVQDAKSFRSGKKAVVSKKKQQLSPRFQKPGRGNKSKSVKQSEAKIRRLKQTHSSDDLASILLDRM